MKRPGTGKKTRLSQPNLHIAPVRTYPPSQSSIESQDSAITYEGTQSTTPCPPSYSPSQRSRYSQPNLPTLMIPYNEQHRHSVSPDRRIRMLSQPTLNSSFSGINFVGTMKGSPRLSYSSLRASGDNSINRQIEEERLSTPNVHSLGGYCRENQGPRLSQPDVRRMLRVDPVTGKRERLSQPTLVTGDYYPGRVQQRLSQPCLSTWKENPLSIQSAMKFKRIGIPSPVKVTQRDRLSQLDFGGSRYRTSKDFTSSVKFNRDRFSIPELETQNDLRLMAGTPKQRFSLDSQLNPEGRRQRLLPIASSPISEHQGKGDEGVGGLKGRLPTEGLESVLVTSATPIFAPQDRQFLAPILKTTPPPPILPLTRERMSVPEIRNSSLRRLLDPPMKQRHSITGNLRQSLLVQTKTQELILTQGEPCRKSARASIDEAIEKLARIEAEKGSIEAGECKKEEPPKHIQRHYSYTYDVKDEPTQVIGRLSVSLPKKKYLESNFDENEQVITTVIETEIPMILSSPKYMKKTHVYSSEAPKWMKKCLENESPKVVRKMEKTDVNKTNQKNILRGESRQVSPEKTVAKKASPKKSGAREMQYLQPKILKPKTLKTTGINWDGSNQTAKNTYVTIKPSGNVEEQKYEVTVDMDWPEQDMSRTYGIDGDSDSEDSTSI